MAKTQNAAQAAENTQDAGKAPEVPQNTQTEESSTEPMEQTRPVIYTVSLGVGLNVREGPGYKYPVRRVLPFGAAVMAVGEEQRDDDGNVWLPVLDGYALRAYLLPEAVTV